MVGFAPEGVADILARHVCEKLAKYNGHPCVVDNRPGAAGNIAAGIVAKASPDGHQILVTPGSVLSMNPSLYSKVPFAADSFASVSLLADMAVLLVVHARNPAGDLGQFISEAKRKPGQMLFSSPGGGNSLHLSLELFQRIAGARIQHVPYKGGSDAMTALLGEQVTGMFVNPPLALPHVRTGKLKTLAVAGSARLPCMPDVPSTEEAGLNGFNVTSWFGAVAPAKTPVSLVKLINARVVSGLQEPDVRQSLSDLGMRSSGAAPRNSGDSWSRTG